jgi:hypothetical protein
MLLTCCLSIVRAKWRWVLGSERCKSNPFLSAKPRALTVYLGLNYTFRISHVAASVLRINSLSLVTVFTPL